MNKRARLVLCIVLLFALILSATFACSSDDPSSLNQTTPMGTVRLWVNAINNKSITEVASCIYDVSDPNYSTFVVNNQASYILFSQSQFIAITDYKEIGRNDAYAKYEVTLSIKRQLTATTENGTASESLTTIDSITSPYHFKKTSLGRWLFTTEPTPTAGNAQGEGFTLEKEDLETIPVTFETNGGSAITVQEVTEGSAVVEPASPTRLGYTFQGWYTGQSFSKAWDFETIVTKDVQELTLYAKWSSDEQASSEASISTINRVEYTFSTDDNFVVNVVKSKDDATDTQFSFSTGLMFTEAPDHWGVYLDRNGSIPSPKIVTLTPGETAKYYVIITAKDGATTNIYDFNIYLKRDYTLTYVDGGEPIDGTSATLVEEGNTLVLPKEGIVAKAGYQLVGWQCDGLDVNTNTKVYKDMVLTPEWEAKYQEVTLICGGGALSSGAQTATTTITYGDLVNIETPKRTGYIFRKWTLNGHDYTDAKGNLLKAWDIYDQENVVLLAVYERESYHISYLGVAGLDYQGITTYNYEQYTDRNPYVFPIPSKAGYAFVEWRIMAEGSGYASISQIDGSVFGDLELQAQWTEETYNVYYNTFDGVYDEQNLVWKEVVSMRDQKKYKDTLVDTPLVESDLTFVGWYLEPTFKTLLTSSYRPTSDTNLYARWTEGYTQGLTFSHDKDGKYEVRQYSGTADVVTIPSTYLGIEVVSIVAGCFKNQPLTTIDLSRATNLTSIGVRAFENCTNLSTVTIPSNVTSIGDGIFSGCASLKSINLPTYSSTYGGLGRLFGDTEPSSANFYRATQEVKPQDLRTYFVPNTLTDVTIAKTNITAGFAENMTSIKNVTISSLDSMTTIGVGAFRGCKNLVNVNIPSTVTAIGAEAFSGCVALSTSFGIPSSVTSIGKSAFRDVTVSLVLPNGLVTLGDNALEDYRGASIDIANVTSIGKECFKDAINLTSIDLTKVSAVGAGAFINCKALATVNLSTSLTRIEAETFSSCVSLTHLTLSQNVTYIGANAFFGCENSLELTLYTGTTSVTPLDTCTKTLIFI